MKTKPKIDMSIRDFRPKGKKITVPYIKGEQKPIKMTVQTISTSTPEKKYIMLRVPVQEKNKEGFLIKVADPTGKQVTYFVKKITETDIHEDEKDHIPEDNASFRAEEPKDDMPPEYDD